MLVCSEVVHHDHNLLLLVDGLEVVEERGEYVSIDGTRMKLYVLKATSFADSCNHSRVLGAHRFAGHVDIFGALAPLAAHVGRLGEHGFINPYYLQLPCNGTLQSAPHFQFKGLIPAISGLHWHLGRTNDFPLDDIGLVNGAQSPRLDELVWVGAVEEDAPLLDTLGDPL